MNVRDFITKYPPRPPHRPHVNVDELRQLGATDGVLILDAAPAQGQQGVPNDPNTRHLWVFRAPEPTDIPYLLETALGVTPKLTSGVAKHTNLTGGGAASCGGELWIDVSNARRLFVSGASGRYGPTTREQLDDAVAVLAELGFAVVSYGWDQETHKPHSLYYDDGRA